MEVIIELDGIRHKLVECLQENICDGCSLYKVCSKSPGVLCDFPGHDMAVSYYEILK